MSGTVWRTEDVSKFLGVTHKRVYELVKYEGLPARRLGYGWSYDESLVRDWHRHWVAGVKYDAQKGVGRAAG